jgi:hypothetical protein
MKFYYLFRIYLSNILSENKLINGLIYKRDLSVSNIKRQNIDQLFIIHSNISLNFDN